MRAVAWISVAAVLVGVAACAGGSQQVPQSPAFAAGAAAPDRGRPRKARARVRILIPRRRHRRGERYVSASTKSVAVSVDGGAPAVVNLTLASGNCSTSDTGLVCHFGISTTLGAHVFSFTTYDQTNAGGNVLSANTSVPYTVASGSTTLSVTLGGVAASLSIAVTSSVPAVTGSQATGFTMYGNSAHDFTVLPVDADGNYIMGAGAPAVSFSPQPPSSNLGVATPSPADPNVWALKSSYQSGNPLTSSSATVTIVSTPVPNSGGKNVTASVPFTLYQPWLYVTDEGTDLVNASDEEGNAKTVTGTDPFSHVPAPTAIVYDPNNQWLYIADGGAANVVCVYDVEGNLITVTPNTWASVGDPTGGTYAPNHTLYFTNAGNGEASIPANVSSYDEGGTSISAGNAFPNAGGPNGAVYDSHTSTIYTSDGIGETVHAYDESGNPVPLSPGFPTVAGSDLTGIAFDPSNDFIYVTDYLNNTVDAYDENGNAQTLAGTWANVSGPESAIYDPYNGLIYVVNSGSNVVTSYDAQGDYEGAITYSSTSRLWGIAVVP